MKNIKLQEHAYNTYMNEYQEGHLKDKEISIFTFRLDLRSNFTSINNT